MVRCIECKIMFQSSNDFVQHDCPAIAIPGHDEDWDDFKARSAKVTEAYWAAKDALA